MRNINCNNKGNTANHGNTTPVSELGEEREI